MNAPRLLALLVLLGSCCHLDAQIGEMRIIDGKPVTCWRSGLISGLGDCGTRSDWYAYVFIGTISAVTPAAKDEEQLEILPEEVFSGQPDSPLTVQTSQGFCLPRLAVGDRWLFFLRKEPDKPMILDYYGNASLPVARAQDQIATLRRLRNLGDLGILKGRVVPGWSSDRHPIPNEHVVATHKQDGQQFSSLTDSEGRYEFPPLPPGDYELAASESDAFQPDPAQIELKAGACWNLTLSRSPHTEISGHIKFPGGKAAAKIGVVLIDEDNTGYVTRETDEDGHFEFTDLMPGKFVVGIDFPKRPDWFTGGGGGVNVKLPPASLFYPGVTARSSARVIELKTDEKLTDIDITLFSR